MRLIVLILFVFGFVFCMEEMSHPTGHFLTALVLMIGSGILLRFIPRYR